MRTLAQLDTLLSQFLSSDLDAFVGETPATADYTDCLNWAYRLIARKCKLMILAQINLTAGVSTYDLRATSPATCVVPGGSTAVKILKPHRVAIAQSWLWDYSRRKHGLWTMQELIEASPWWQKDGNSIPRKAIFYNYNQLLFHPPPDTATAAGLNYVYGQYLPLDMVNTTDTPAIPEEIHEAIAFLGAVNAATPVATEEEAWHRLEQYNGYWTSVVNEVADENERTMQGWGSSFGSSWDDVMPS